MAQVFLSYDRADGPRAKALAQALEKAGHFVWCDLHIKGGAEYGKVIEEALEAADAVIVLWSAQSINSAWVRDEAAAGRDSGRLIPILLEPVTPPMGFRQYQNLDFGGWKGRGNPPRMSVLLDSISSLGQAPAKPEADLPASSGNRAASARPKKLLVVAGIILTVVVAVGLFVGLVLNKPGQTSEIYSVAVTASDKSADAIAGDLRAKLGSLQSTNPIAMNLLDESAAPETADLIIKVSRSVEPEVVKVNLLLLRTSDRSILWSRDFEQPKERQADLEQQLAFSAGRLAGCALDGMASKPRLSEHTFKLYLNGCDQMADILGVYNRPIVPIFIEVVRESPRFAGGWGKLLIAEAQVVANELSDNAKAQANLRMHVAQARQVDPNLAEAAYASIVLLAGAPLADQIALSEAAIEAHPNHPFLLQQGAWLLSTVGRMEDSVELARRASESDPLSIRARTDYISILAYAGQADTAQRELEAAEKLWPNTISVLDARFRVDSRYGDAKRALEIDRSGVFGKNEMLRAFMLARIQPTAANVDRAIAETRAQLNRDPRATGYLIQIWGEFGRENEMFEAIDRWPDSALRGATTLTYFRPPLDRFRKDARFMKVAKRAGLVDYWRKSGKWPDFCFDSDLPYDCKAEAVKLS